ncbi:MAG: MaoC family dehydratase N-terminal domain-containing protein [Dehalococcoidia bacterium]
MTAPARTLLSELPKGYRFPETHLRLTREEVERYLNAVGDRNPLYIDRSIAPPLAAAARSLATLLEQVELPAASLHTGQELALNGGVPIDTPLTFRGGVAQRSERAGMVIAILEFELALEGASNALLSGRTTVLMPVPGGAS